MRPASAPSRLTRSSGATPLPRDLDITWPWRLTMPCVKRRRNGSTGSTSPASCRTFSQKRGESRWRSAGLPRPPARAAALPPVAGDAFALALGGQPGRDLGDRLLGRQAVETPAVDERPDLVRVGGVQFTNRT